MQENEFEKQVRHKMDEFRVHPSDPVWPGIREELRKKKRRRLLFIPLFGMLLVAGYFGRNLFAIRRSLFDVNCKQDRFYGQTLLW